MLEREADAATVKLEPAALLELMQIVRDHLDELNDIREAELLRAVAKSRPSGNSNAMTDGLMPEPILTSDNPHLSEPTGPVQAAYLPAPLPVEELPASVLQYVQAAYSENTRRAYRADLRTSCDWGGADTSHGPNRGRIPCGARWSALSRRSGSQACGDKQGPYHTGPAVAHVV